MSGRLKYAEGDWFAVPLRDHGFAVGLVARANPHGVLCGYFFGPRHDAVPDVEAVAGLHPLDALLVTKFGHLGLRSGKWPIMGQTDWRRSDWPMPHFGRYEELTGRSWEVVYDNDDPNRVLSESQVSDDVRDRLPDDGLGGAGWVEIRLTRLLNDEQVPFPTGENRP